MWCYRCYHPQTHERLYVEAFYLPASDGVRDCWGAPLEPGTPESLVIERVVSEAGEELPPEAIAEVETHLVAEGFYAQVSGLLL